MTKVLVTGGADMLGSKIVKELTETGYDVRIMSRRGRSSPIYRGRAKRSAFKFLRIRGKEGIKGNKMKEGI